MKLTDALRDALAQGFSQIGQIAVLQKNDGYLLCHLDEREKVADGDFSDLTRHENPADAIEISRFAPDGHYRFTKGELSLKSGWYFQVLTPAELRDTLDNFYPAAFGLWLAKKENRLHVQNLREKLGRQSGMYRHARKVSDAGAQDLVREICGPANQCVKKILWQLDDETPLDDSEASRFPGIVGGKSEPDAIPLVCQEACNYFVSQCRAKAKAEFEAE